MSSDVKVGVTSLANRDPMLFCLLNLIDPGLPLLYDEPLYALH